MELVPEARPGPPSGQRPPRGHYELRELVIRGRPVEGVRALWWVPGDGARAQQEMVIVDDRLPLLAETVATFLVKHQLPFGAAAQGSLRRAGVPFPAEPEPDDPYEGGAS
jgi:hypothetical protein